MMRHRTCNVNEISLVFDFRMHKFAMEKNMGKLGVVFCLLLVSYALTAYTSTSDDALTEIAKIEASTEMCSEIISINKLVLIGEPAVDSLDDVLSNSANGLKAKAGAAKALGEIGSIKALPTLTAISEANGPNSFNFYIGNVAREAISKIRGEKPKLGKFHLITESVQTTKTDCESGQVEIIK